MEGFILFIVVCLVIGVVSRMAMGQSLGVSMKNTGGAFIAPTKMAAKVVGAGIKASKRL